jgi:hypothetical protein
VHRIADYQDPALRNATPCPLRAKPDAINPNSFRILPLTGSLRRLRRLPLQEHDGAQRHGFCRAEVKLNIVKLTK